jgi:hypothetical protein
MRKVEGSSLFIRFEKKPRKRGFLLAEMETKEIVCNRFCNQTCNV